MTSLLSSNPNPNLSLHTYDCATHAVKLVQVRPADSDLFKICAYRSSFCSTVLNIIMFYSTVLSLPKSTCWNHSSPSGMLHLLMAQSCAGKSRPSYDGLLYYECTAPRPAGTRCRKRSQGACVSFVSLLLLYYVFNPQQILKPSRLILLRNSAIPQNVYQSLGTI